MEDGRDLEKESEVAVTWGTLAASVTSVLQMKSRNEARGGLKVGAVWGSTGPCVVLRGLTGKLDLPVF